ncbi:MAG: hypothetical protein ACAI35_28065 [Candidatus Methylacidiphilales bacterium]|nr:hypothetical protein [Candidatus Methylacidiphilales bacterium]
MGKARRLRREYREKLEEQQEKAALIQSRKTRIVANLYAETMQEFLEKTYYTPLLAIVNVVAVIAIAGRSAVMLPVIAPGMLSFAFLYLMVQNLLEGVTSSNHGTYYRDKQPVGFWIGFSIIAIAYIAITAASIVIGFGTMLMKPAEG